MAYLPIIQNNGRTQAALQHRQLPSFYMEDFSILGFRVNDCDRAIRVLKQHDFTLQRIEDSIEVGIEGTSQMHAAMQLLNVSGLTCEIADIADGLYQG